VDELAEELCGEAAWFEEEPEEEPQAAAVTAIRPDARRISVRGIGAMFRGLPESLLNGFAPRRPGGGY
jgi:hypothetical protein